MNNAKQIAVNLSEVVDSSQFQALCAGTDPETWEGALSIQPLLSDCDLNRCIRLLTMVGSLGGLLSMGQAQLAELNILGPEECDRFAVLPTLASRLLLHQLRREDQSTRGDVAREICFRGIHWDTVHVGLIGWDGSGRRVVDRIIAVGTTRGATVEVRQALRLAIASGAISLVVWNFFPTAKLEVGAQERVLADELRMMATPLGIGIEDVIFVSPGDAISLGMLDGWAR